MENENKTIENENKDSMSAEDYVAKVNELKEKMIDKSEYEKLKNENKVLADAVLNSQEVKVNEESNDNEKIQELRKELFDSEKVVNLTNLEFAEKALALRDALIKENPKNDPFLPSEPTAFDIEKADKVAETLKDYIEQAEGNPDIFRGLFEGNLSEIKGLKK